MSARRYIQREQRTDTHWHNILVLRLADELSEYTQVGQRSLSIRYPHNSMHTNPVSADDTQGRG
jgi:hypothetical protein